MKLTIYALLMLSFSFAFSQHILKDIYRSDKNFYDIQREANAFFEENGTGKGTGYKQYKRWEYQVESKVYPSGDLSLVNSNQASLEYERWKNRYSVSRRAGADFTEFGKTSWVSASGWNPGNGRINHVTEHPTDTATIFVCSAAGGLWRTNDLGGSWENVTDGYDVDATSVVAFDSGFESKIYLATGDRDGGDGATKGVFISEDGGDTWTQSSLDNDVAGGRIFDMVVHPNNPGHVYVAATSGLYETTDGGVNWTKIQNRLISDIEFQPGNPSTMFFLNTNLFYKSTDGGQTLNQITTGLPTYSNIGRVLIAVAPSNADYVYYLFSKDNLYGGLYRSTDAGETFTRMSEDTDQGVGNLFGYEPDGSSENGQAWYDMAIDVSDDDEDEVHIGGILTFVTYDGGVSWDNTSIWRWPTNEGYNHADIHYIEYMGDRLFVCSDGGIFVSYDHGDYWHDLTEGLGITQYYRFDIAPTSELRIVAGAQDNGTNVYNNGEWLHWLGADGMDCAINYNSIDNIYGSVQLGSFYKTSTGGTSHSVVQQLHGPWITPLTMDPNNPAILYAGTSSMWRTFDGFSSVEELTSYSGGEVKEIAVAKSNSDVVYVCSSDEIFKSSDAGSNWTNISTGLPDQTINYIAVNPTDENDVFICYGGYDANDKVYTSKDGGSTWQNITLNLPNISCNSIVYRNVGTDILYLGTERSVYYFDEDDNTWYEYGNGLPFVEVSEIKIHEESETIYVATYGRGIWRSPLSPIEKVNNDGGLISFQMPIYNCGPNLHPIVKVNNRGLNSITSMTIDYEVDGSTISTNWSGFIAENGITEIELEMTTLAEGEYEINAEIIDVNGFTDNNDFNNTTTSSLTQTSLDSSWFEVIIQPDNYASETSYYLRTTTNQELDHVEAIGENFDTDLFKKRYGIDQDCYKVHLKDLYGDGFCCEDGNGYLLVLTNCGDTLAFEDGDFSGNKFVNICPGDYVGVELIDETKFEVFPNPAEKQFFINADFKVETLKVYNGVGQLMFTKDLNGSLTQYPVDINQWNSGLYFVHLQGEGISTQRKVFIVNDN